MTSKERVRLALEHKEPDRVPMNFYATPEIMDELRKHFGIRQDHSVQNHLSFQIDPQLAEALEIDFRILAPRYVGPELKTFEDGSYETLFGAVRSPVKTATGGVYHEWSYLPFAKAKTAAEVDAHRWPSVDWFDFSNIKEQLDEFEGYAVIAGDQGTVDFLNRSSFLSGYERVLIGLVTEDPVVMRVFDHLSDFFYEFCERLFEAGKGKIDIVNYGDDLGSQKGALISVNMYRRVLRPRWKRHIDLAREYDLKIMQHCCGSVRELYPALIETGIDIHETVQPYVAKMDLEEIKREFGDRLCFHGAISVQQILHKSSKEEVVAEVKRVIDILGVNGGYILCPTHAIQAGTPLENVIAMYETAKEYSQQFYASRKNR